MPGKFYSGPDLPTFKKEFMKDNTGSPITALLRCIHFRLGF